MDLFDFDDYKKFVRARIASMPKGGHGQFRKLSIYLTINSVNVTQIFKGNRDLTVEQACLVSEFFGLSELETEYFVSLVEKARAGSHTLKKLIQKRLDSIKARSQNLKDRLPQKATLTEEAKAIFYSNWFYSGVRLLTSIKEFDNPDKIAAYYNLSLSTVNRVLDFLSLHGLVVEEKGRFKMGPSSTHLDASSPLVSRHHLNWRMKAVEKLDHISSDELFLTLPCSLNKDAFLDIRKELILCIERITRVIDDAPSEKVAVLNIDLFKF